MRYSAAAGVLRLSRIARENGSRSRTQPAARSITLVWKSAILQRRTLYSQKYEANF